MNAVREAGRLLLAEHGPEALTTTRIAERAGVSVGSIYQYFENKEAILRAIHDEVAEKNLATVPDLVAALQDMDPKLRIRVGIEYAAERHRKLMELDADYYREHHLEYRLEDATEIDAEKRSEFGQRAVELARELLRAEEPNLNGSVNIDHAAFLLGRGISGILRAAVEYAPELLQDPSFLDEIVKMMTRYVYPGESSD